MEPGVSVAGYGEEPPEHDIPGSPVKVSVAAELAVHTQQSVLTLSAIGVIKLGLDYTLEKPPRLDKQKKTTPESAVILGSCWRRWLSWRGD